VKVWCRRCLMHASNSRHARPSQTAAGRPVKVWCRRCLMHASSSRHARPSQTAAGRPVKVWCRRCLMHASSSRHARPSQTAAGRPVKVWCRRCLMHASNSRHARPSQTAADGPVKVWCRRCLMHASNSRHARPSQTAAGRPGRVTPQAKAHRTQAMSRFTQANSHRSPSHACNPVAASAGPIKGFAGTQHTQRTPRKLASGGVLHDALERSSGGLSNGRGGRSSCDSRGGHAGLGAGPFEAESFDAVLLDPPCSALGIRPRLTHGWSLQQMRSMGR